MGDVWNDAGVLQVQLIWKGTYPWTRRVDWCSHLPREVDAVLITSPENRLYFTGFLGEGVLLLTRNPFFFFAARWILSSAQKIIRDMQVLLFGHGISPVAGDAKQVFCASNCSGIAVSFGGAVEKTEGTVSTGGVCGDDRADSTDP